MRSALGHNQPGIFVRPLILVSFLFVLCASVVNFHAQDFKTIHDGVEYAQVNHKLGDDPVKINLLRLDLKKVRLHVRHALDAAIGTEQTSSIATRHGAVAAINAGFFRLDTSMFAGDASGLLMIDGRLLSESTNDRTALQISNIGGSTKVEILPVRTETFFRIRTKEVRISGINREVKIDEVVLFTPDFHKTTLTGPDVFEVAVEKDRVVHLSSGQGSTPIMAYGFVLSATGSQIPTLRSFKVGDKVVLGTRFLPASRLKTVDDMVAGVPQLVKNGRIDITWEQEKAGKAFVFNRHPRTAVAKLKDGKFLMITVDGRQPGVSVGMTLPELAEYLHSLGAVDALNLDGGGSATMFLDGKVVNKPSDPTGERKVGDVLVVTARGKNIRRMR